MSAQKRSHEAVDPDYADAGEQQVKRQRVLEQDAKESVSRKIKTIVQNEFKKEINLKETELQNIDKRLNDALLQMDRLRACIVASYYGQKHPSSSSQVSAINAPPPSIHPAVKKHIGKAPKGQLASKPGVIPQVGTHTESHERLRPKQITQDSHDPRSDPATDSHRSFLTFSSGSTPLDPTSSERHSRFKIKKKIIVGNVSKYIPVDSREANDMSSHKWMVYVRGPKADPDISGFVRKVWFFLHHSYKPNDLVEVSSPPFHLTRRGWGEFPVRVQLHFVDPRNKKLDIIHHLKLDKTFTGLQTLGAETVVEVELNRESSSIPWLGRPGVHSPCPESQLQNVPSSLSSEKEIHPCKNNSEHKPLESQYAAAFKPHIKNLMGNDHSESEQSVSLSDINAAIKNEIIQNEEVVGAQNHGKPIEAEEYHMTIAHEPSLSLADTIKKELDHEVDVCVDDDYSGNIILPESNVSNDGICISSNKSLTLMPKEEPMDTLNSKLPSLSGSHFMITNAVSSNTEEHNPASLPLKPLSAPSAMSSVIVQQSSYSLNSHIENVEISASFSEKHSFNQPMKLTVIEDPSKFKHPLERTSGDIAETTTNMEVVLTSSTSSTSCVTNTSTTTTANVEITGSIPSAPTFLQPKIVTRNSVDIASNLPFQTIQEQQPEGAISKVVVIKSNPSLPRKLVHKGSKSVLPTSLVSSSQPLAYETVSGEASYTSLNPPISHSIPVSSNVQPVVIASSPPVHGIKSGTSRQVSLLTGLVVGGQPSSSPHVSPSPSPSLLKSRTIRDNKIVINPAVSHSISSNTITNIPGKASQSQPPQVPQIVLLNKTNADGHTVVISKPSVVPSINQTHTLGGRTVIKVLNKSALSQTTSQVLAPIKLLSSIPKKVDSHPKPVTLVSNVQSLLAHGGNRELLSAQSSLDQGFSGITPVKIEVKPGTQPSNSTTSSSSPQVMLSFPSGTTMPLTQELEMSRFPKMSAVGITKYGKGYRSILNQQGSKKNLSHEDRLKGQYEVLRAFKENPELYRKKSKKVVLATNDTIEGEEDIIPRLQLQDYQTMRSMLKAAILRHPLVQDSVNKITHPYCARSLEEWHSWPIGKQRAAEWHRACFTLRYLKLCLAGQAHLGGEKLMSPRQLVDWCRLRAFSPALPVKPTRLKCPDTYNGEPSRVNASAVKSESFYHSLLRHQLQSFTLLDGLHPLLSVAQAELLKRKDRHDSDEEVNVIGEDTSLTATKKESTDDDKIEIQDLDEWISPSEGAIFVQDELRKRGVRLQPQRLDTGIMACLPAEMIYTVMMEFCSDVLRETLAMCDDPSSELTGRDVHHGLTSLPEASFCCNKFLGKQEEQEMEVAVSR